MNLVYLNPSGQMGGAEVALLELIAAMREAEPEWKLNLIVAGDGAMAAKARSLGVETTILKFPNSLARIGDASAGGPAGQGMSKARLLARLLFAGPGIVNYSRRLRSELRRLNVAMIHTNGFKMHILGALAKPPGIPLIWHVHDYLSSRPLMALLMQLFHKRCSLVVANSNSIKKDIESVCGKAVPLKTVYNALDTTEFSPEGPSLNLDELSDMLPPAVAVVRVGMLATFARWKGHESFLRALSLIPKSVPLRAYIIGDALYQTDGSQYSMAELRAIAEDLSIVDRVGFTGFIAAPASAMRSLDIVVHASTQPEPFGLVIAEAMACGKAVIMSEGGGALELIETGRNAMGHRPGDSEELAERITQLATDPELRAQLGSAGRATAEYRFSRSRLVTEFVPLYEKLVFRSDV